MTKLDIYDIALDFVSFSYKLKAQRSFFQDKKLKERVEQKKTNLKIL